MTSALKSRYLRTIKGVRSSKDKTNESKENISTRGALPSFPSSNAAEHHPSVSNATRSANTSTSSATPLERTTSIESLPEFDPELSHSGNTLGANTDDGPSITFEVTPITTDSGALGKQRHLVLKHGSVSLTNRKGNTVLWKHSADDVITLQPIQYAPSSNSGKRVTGASSSTNLTPRRDSSCKW